MMFCANLASFCEQIDDSKSSKAITKMNVISYKSITTVFKAENPLIILPKNLNKRFRGKNEQRLLSSKTAVFRRIRNVG